MNKKGSMELGINAIVILIIALALLGLAMAFVTNLFKGGERKLGGLIERTDLPVHADAGNPLVFDSADITVKSGKNAKVVISVYNNNFGDEDVGLDMVCIDSDGNDKSGISINAPYQKITRGMDGGYRAIIYVDSSVDAGTYICTVTAVGGEATVSQQLFVNVVV